MWRLWKFFRDKALELVAGGVAAAITFVAYYVILLGGFRLYSVVVIKGNEWTVWLADNLPLISIHGWEFNGTLRNMALQQNAGDHALEALIGGAVVVILLALRKLFHHCRRFLRRRLQPYVGGTVEETTPLETQRPTERGVTAVRRFFDSFIAVLAALAALGVIVMIPMTYLGIMPWVAAVMKGVPALSDPSYVGVVQTFVSYGIYGLMAYSVFNTWSGLTVHASTFANRADNAFSWLAWLVVNGTLLIVVVQLLAQTNNIKHVYEAVSSMQLLTATVLYSWFDVLVIQRHKHWIARSMLGAPEPERAAATAGYREASPRAAPYFEPADISDGPEVRHGGDTILRIHTVWEPPFRAAFPGQMPPMVRTRLEPPRAYEPRPPVEPSRAAEPQRPLPPAPAEPVASPAPATPAGEATPEPQPAG